MAAEKEQFRVVIVIGEAVAVGGKLATILALESSAHKPNGALKGLRSLSLRII